MRDVLTKNSTSRVRMSGKYPQRGLSQTRLHAVRPGRWSSIAPPYLTAFALHLYGKVSVCGLLGQETYLSPKTA